MLSVTFLYKIDNSIDTYKGKYVYDFVSVEHFDSLLDIVPLELLTSLNIHRKHTNLQPLEITQINTNRFVFSIHGELKDYPIKNEFELYDFYYENHIGNLKIHVNGYKLNNM